jgi:hypothetical protein
MFSRGQFLRMSKDADAALVSPNESPCSHCEAGAARQRVGRELPESFARDVPSSHYPGQPPQPTLIDFDDAVDKKAVVSRERLIRGVLSKMASSVLLTRECLELRGRPGGKWSSIELAAENMALPRRFWDMTVVLSIYW